MRAWLSSVVVGTVAIVVATGYPPMLGAGPRKNATVLPFQFGDRVSAQADVGSVNLVVSARGLQVPAAGNLSVDLVYNSLAVGAGVDQTSTANEAGFGQSLSVGVRLTRNRPAKVNEHGGPCPEAGPLVRFSTLMRIAVLVDGPTSTGRPSESWASSSGRA